MSKLEELMLRRSGIADKSAADSLPNWAEMGCKAPSNAQKTKQPEGR